MAQRIGVIGATGRLGAVIAAGVAVADDLELVAAVTRTHAGRRLGDVLTSIPRDLPAAGLVLTDDLEGIRAAGAEVVVEVTGPATVGAHLRWALEHGLHAVVGATGLSEEDLEAARTLAAVGPARALVVPNFSIGAVLVERFAAQAARYFPHVEIVELHHDRKIDAPSGTAIATAAAVARARGDGAPTPAAMEGEALAPGARGSLHHGVPIHAVRLPGLLAHEEVLLGGEGQLLTLRHDTSDRSAFVAGALLACRAVPTLAGLEVGLDALL
jgi:4-hydroxy-tetrahydrodipicolinate reductase